MADPAIEIDGLVRRFGDLTAVDGLTLTVPAGETLALLGPNGAGKTTTIECLEGYQRPDQGAVRVLGLDPWKDRDRLRARVGLMLQDGGVYPVAYPGEVLRLFARYYADPLDPDQLLAHVGLTGASRTRFRDLSGGQKQRLSLALALVGRPEVVFLDEPTAGLDVSARRMTWEHVRHLQAEGVTIVLTTHLLDEAEELADRVAIVDRGRLVAVGTPDELTSGEGADVRFTARPGLDVVALGEAIGTAVQEHRPGRYVVAGEGTPALVASLTGWLAEQGESLGDLQAGRRSLEDVFVRLTTEPELVPAALAGGAGGRRRGRGGRGGRR